MKHRGYRWVGWLEQYIFKSAVTAWMQLKMPFRFPDVTVGAAGVAVVLLIPEN